MDLGITKPSATIGAPEESQKKSYPGFVLNDDQVDLVKGEHDCKVGDEYTATVRLRVNRVSDDEIGKTLGFEVVDLDKFTPVSGEAEGGEGTSEDSEKESEDDAEETRILGFKRSKVKPKNEMPDTSAKSFAY